MTRYLLDTHVWLWLQTDPERVSGPVLAQLADPGTVLLLSAASSWEIAIKHRLGKLPLPEAPVRYVPDRMRRSGTTGLAVEHAHALAVAELPPHHRDPFDRLLVAQARHLGVPIVTADPAFDPYDVDVVGAT
jgi:PIN domain nuclease of toxin-antitoxin system